MNIIITSGGTSEQIDKVRKITNMSTGKLGAKIADAISSNFDNSVIFFLSDINLTLPEIKNNIKIIPTTDTKSVLINLQNLISNNKIDYVIHAMAISDYTVESVFNENNIKEVLEKYLSQSDINVDTLTEKIVNEINGVDKNSKISSNMDNLFIKLVKTPKIVDLIKKFDNNIKLISFKLLNGVSEEELIEVARKQLIRTNSEFVVANDLVNIKNGNHRALFVGKNEEIVVEGKEKIADKIVSYLEENKTLFLNKKDIIKKYEHLFSKDKKTIIEELICPFCGNPIFTYDKEYYQCTDCRRVKSDYHWTRIK